MWTPGNYPPTALVRSPDKDPLDHASPPHPQQAAYAVPVILSVLDDQALILRLFPDGEGRRGAERVLRELRERFKRLEDPADEGETDDEEEEPNPLD